MRDPGDAAAVDGIRVWLRDHLGLEFGHERERMLGQRLASVSTRLVISLTELRARLEAGDRELAIAVAEDVSTNHTAFLREPETFVQFTDHVIPSLPRRGELRFWSAAASSGEEAFSIAISASQALGAAEARARVRVLGTDISDRQIQRAERGVFARAQVTSQAPALLPFFEPMGPLHIKVRAEIAERCVFRRMNLTQARWPFTQRFHVVFLRNVLYYFSPAMREQVLASCWAATEAGGWLITSLTEPMLETASPWLPQGAGLFRKPSGAR